jgi:hypothetical protein
MTYLLAPKADDKQRGTHVLLIGVGKYPYLPGGRSKVFPNHQGMGQLSPPPKSVARLAQWFLASHRLPSCPLKSLDVLVSGEKEKLKDHKQKPVAIEAATAQRVRKAIIRWKELGDRNEESILILYFCGHGVHQGEVHSLLLEDFGSDQYDPFMHALASEKLVSGMKCCKAKRQLYLLDACQTVSKNYLDDYENTGIAVFDAKKSKSLAHLIQPVIRASIPGERAFGRKNEASLFAKGFIDVLEGAACSQGDHGEWHVMTENLLSALRDVVPKREPLVKQIASGNVAFAFPFHELQADQEPKIPVWVACDPEARTAEASLAYLPENGAGATARGEPDKAPWQLSLSIGKYDFIAEFPQTGKPRASVKRTVVPFSLSVKIPVS